MKTRIFLGALVASFCAISVVMATPLTGNVQITSGSAGISNNDDTASFSISGSGFSATSSTTASFRASANGGFIPTQETNFSCVGGSGEYMGVSAACFGPFGPPVVAGQPQTPAAYYATEGIGFTPTGTPTFDANGDETGAFTAYGELIGFTPASCAQRSPFTCTELWDVTLTGQGTYTYTLDHDNGEIVGVSLEFEPGSPPSSVPEPSTGLLMWGGILLGAGAMARNKSGAWLRNLLS